MASASADLPEAVGPTTNKAFGFEAVDSLLRSCDLRRSGAWFEAADSLLRSFDLRRSGAWFEAADSLLRPFDLRRSDA
jgi:hypothetical protein